MRAERPPDHPESTGAGEDGAEGTAPNSGSNSKPHKCLLIGLISFFAIAGLCTVLAFVAGQSSSSNPLIPENVTRTEPQEIASYPAWVISFQRLVQAEQYESLRGSPVYVSGTVCDIQGSRVFLYAPLANPEVVDLAVAGCDRWRVSLNGLQQEIVSGLDTEDGIEVICRVPRSDVNDDRRTTYLEACTVPNGETAAAFVTSTPTVTPTPTATPVPIRKELSGRGQDVQIVNLDAGDYFVTVYTLNNQNCLEFIGCTPAHFGVTLQPACELNSEAPECTPTIYWIAAMEVLEENLAGLRPKILANAVADNWDGTSLLRLGVVNSDLPYGPLYLSVSAANDAEWHVVFEEITDDYDERATSAIGRESAGSEETIINQPSQSDLYQTPSTGVTTPSPTQEPVYIELSGVGRDERTIELPEGTYDVTLTVRDNWLNCESNDGRTTCVGAGYFAALVRSGGEGVSGYLPLAQEHGVSSYWRDSTTIEVGTLSPYVLPIGEAIVEVVAEEEGQWEIVIESSS